MTSRMELIQLKSDRRRVIIRDDLSMLWLVKETKKTKTVVDLLLASL